MNTLLIDDDCISIFLLEQLLRREGVADTSLAFHSCQQALRHLQQLPTAQLPDVIFLDLHLPVMSGWDFLEALRPCEDRLRGHCRIYILTSSLAPCDTARAQEFGLVAGLIHKPLDSLEIQAIRAQVAEGYHPG